MVDLENLFHTRVWSPGQLRSADQRPNVGRLKTPMDEDGQFVLRNQGLIERKAAEETERQRQEAERLRREQEEQERLAAERARLKAEQERHKEQAARAADDTERQRQEAERLRREQEEQERLAAERARLEAEQKRLEEERQLLEERKRLEAERRKIEQEKLRMAQEAERLKQEQERQHRTANADPAPAEPPSRVASLPRTDSVALPGHRKITLALLPWHRDPNMHQSSFSESQLNDRLSSQISDALFLDPEIEITHAYPPVKGSSARHIQPIDLSAQEVEAIWATEGIFSKVKPDAEVIAAIAGN